MEALRQKDEHTDEDGQRARANGQGRPAPCFRPTSRTRVGEKAVMTRHPALLRAVSTVVPQAPYRLTRTG
jgi:hypothetical protein